MPLVLSIQHYWAHIYSESCQERKFLNLLNDKDRCGVFFWIAVLYVKRTSYLILQASQYSCPYPYFTTCPSFATEIFLFAANGPIMSPSPTCSIFQVSNSRLSLFLSLQVWEDVRENDLWIRSFLFCHPCNDDDNHSGDDTTGIWTLRFL